MTQDSKREPTVHELNMQQLHGTPINLDAPAEAPADLPAPAAPEPAAVEPPKKRAGKKRKV